MRTITWRLHFSVFQILPEHRLRRIDAPIDHAHEQISKRVRSLSQRSVSALALQRAAIGVDESEITARRILQLEQLIRHVRIALLPQHIHQRHGPLPALRVGDDLALKELPIVHAPKRHSYSSSCARAFATCVPVKGLGTSKTFLAFRERKLASAISGVSLMITTGTS